MGRALRIRAGYEISFDCPQPTPMLLLLNVHPSRAADLESPDTLRTDPQVPVRQYRDLFGNVPARQLAGFAATLDDTIAIFGRLMEEEA